ncbi:MAG: hypothetical protein H7X70_00020 [Candidatus Kapabacteria bacterium]|nr:hypothetical protein [Candidatus Kapabacteria bacterium]
MIIMICAASTTVSSAQFNVVPSGKKLILGKDTLCFHYDLRAHDTLRYKVEANDSINVENGQAFSKRRTEIVEVTCDSVSVDSLMHLSMKLVSARELHIKGADTTVKTTSQWIGRRHRIVIDKLGHRISSSSDNDSVAGIAPGGTMQPMLIPIIDSSCGRQGQSWLSEGTVALVENAIPNPILKQQNFWRVVDHHDTLGRKASILQYTQTGVGAVTLKTRDVQIETMCVVAGYGRLMFDREWNVIIHQYATVENKFTMKLLSGTDVKGRHLTAQNVTLIEMISRDPSRRWTLSPK